MQSESCLMERGFPYALKITYLFISTQNLSIPIILGNLKRICKSPCSKELYIWNFRSGKKTKNHQQLWKRKTALKNKRKPDHKIELWEDFGVSHLIGMFDGTTIGSPLRPHNFKKSCYFMRVSIKEMCNIKTYKCFWFLQCILSA